MPSNYNIDAIRSLVHDFKHIANAFGWIRNIEERKQSVILECTFMALLRHYFNQGRSTHQPLTEIIKELREELPSFGQVTERDLILSVLLFEYDKGLLKRSKELISKTWDTVDVRAINRKFTAWRYQPLERRDVYGVSLALFFEYPSDFLSATRKILQPIVDITYETKRHHFTIFNIGTKIPIEEVNPICELIKEELEREFRRNSHLGNLATSLQKAAIKAEMHVMPDGSLVFFGAGDFLKAMHELRLKLRERVLPSGMESILARDAQPVWTHTVFSRIVDVVSPSQLSDMRRECLPESGATIRLDRAKIALMVFKDDKAILPPEVMEIEVGATPQLVNRPVLENKFQSQSVCQEGPRANMKKIAIVTTPYDTEDLTAIRKWTRYIQQHFAESLASGQIVKLVIAMPTRIKDHVRRELEEIVASVGSSLCCFKEMLPGYLGAGDTFRGAVFFAFENSAADYVLHIPIDVDFGNSHSDDLQDNLRSLLDPINSASGGAVLPDLLVGDYHPKLWNEEQEKAEEHPFKVMIEEHVKEQLRHYFPKNVTEKQRREINQPRSEFFVMSKRLFEAVASERKFSPYDPIPQVLLYADRRGWRVKKVPLGTFYEKREGEFSFISIREQVFRTEDQIRREWLRYEHASELAPKELLLRAKEWERKVSEGMMLAFKAWEKMLRYKVNASGGGDVGDDFVENTE